MAESAKQYKDNIRECKSGIEATGILSIINLMAVFVVVGAILVFTGDTKSVAVILMLDFVLALDLRFGICCFEDSMQRSERELAKITSKKEESKPAEDSLIPMTGKLTLEILHHNLERVKEHGPMAEVFCEQAEKYLATVKGYYEKLDQLAALGDDQKTVILIRRNFDAVSAEIYAMIANVIKLCVLVDSDPKAYEAAFMELAKIEELLDQNQFGQSLYELAIEQTPVLTAPSAAEEIARLKELSDSLLNGLHGDRMVAASEIFSD